MSAPLPACYKRFGAQSARLSGAKFKLTHLGDVAPTWVERAVAAKGVRSHVLRLSPEPDAW